MALRKADNCLQNNLIKVMDFTENDTEVNVKEFISDSTRVWGDKNKRRNCKNTMDIDEEPLQKRPTPSIRLGSGFKWNLLALSRAADSVISGSKSPVCVLNELGVNVSYNVVREAGPAHAPRFFVTVTVADLTFEGTGHSKRSARAAAARVCLETLLARAGRVLPTQQQNIDFTADSEDYSRGEFQCLEVKAKMKTDQLLLVGVTSNKIGLDKYMDSPQPGPPKVNGSSPKPLFGVPTTPQVAKNPINLLYENYPGLTFECTFGDGSSIDSPNAPAQMGHSMRYKVISNVNGQKFEGFGSSKKLAKLAAARSALSVLDISRDNNCMSSPADFLPQTLADHIGILVLEKFNYLMKNDVAHSKRKVLAGVVITKDNDIHGAKVVAITTGTKCISGEYMSVGGLALNDSHAEVPARRCLQRYLYSQLLLYAQAKDPTIPIAESDVEPLPSGGYRMKPDRNIHLYVSTAPCGDGRIFSPHEEHEPDRHPNRLTRGQLRTKIESGEGTIPVKNSNTIIQTWDGVMQGERLLTMSCSDKMARWCVVGLQGALLSQFMMPVYLTSLVLGSLMHPHHIYRAICGRIQSTLIGLPPPFCHTPPKLARATSHDSRAPARAPNLGVLWCCTTPDSHEIVNATTGKLENGQPSMLCKQSMYARWQYLYKRIPTLPMEFNKKEILDNLPNLSYSEAKELAVNYQIAKKCLLNSFAQAKLGHWIEKPIEQDNFLCEFTDPSPESLFA